MTQPIITTDGLRDNAAAQAEAEIAQWAIAGGTANAIEVAYDTPVTELTDGMIVGFRASATNTTTTPTFARDGLESHTIVKNAGALAAGDILDDGEYLVRYNATAEVWKLLNPET